MAGNTNEAAQFARIERLWSTLHIFYCYAHRFVSLWVHTCLCPQNPEEGVKYSDSGGVVDLSCLERVIGTTFGPLREREVFLMNPGL